MPAQGSVTNTTGYVNYIYNISSRGTAQVASQLLGLSGIAGNILGQIAFQTSSYLSSTEGSLLSLGVVASAGLTKATEFAMKFNQEMETVHAISGKTVTSLANDAMEMSNKFGVALGDMATGLEALARAGVSTGNMTAILEQAMGLSKLEGLTLEQSINDLISTTNLLDTQNLDLESPEYAEAVKYQTQKITATSEAAPINAQDIIHTLEHIGGYASSTHLDQDDLYAVIAQLGSKGTKSEMAGTSLRAFISAGQKDTAQRALKRIGLDVKDLWKDDDTILSISDMKDVLDEAMESRGYTQQEKLEFYSDFAGYKQANQIMKIDTTSVREFKDKIDRSWDTSKKMETVLNTAQTNLQSLMQTGINFLTKVGEPLLLVVSPIAKVAKTMIDIVDAIPFSNWVVALGLSLVSIKAISTIFNKLGPQLLASTNHIFNMSNYWQDTKDAISESYDILKHWKDFGEMRTKGVENEIHRVTDDDKRQYWAEQGYNIKTDIDVMRIERDLKTERLDEIRAWKRERLEPAMTQEEQSEDKPRSTSTAESSVDKNLKLIDNRQRAVIRSIKQFHHAFNIYAGHTNVDKDGRRRKGTPMIFDDDILTGMSDHVTSIDDFIEKIYNILEKGLSQGFGSGGSDSGGSGGGGGRRRPRDSDGPGGFGHSDEPRIKFYNEKSVVGFDFGYTKTKMPKDEIIKSILKDIKLQFRTDNSAAGKHLAGTIQTYFTTFLEEYFNSPHMLTGLSDVDLEGQIVKRLHGLNGVMNTKLPAIIGEIEKLEKAIPKFNVPKPKDFTAPHIIEKNNKRMQMLSSSFRFSNYNDVLKIVDEELKRRNISTSGRTAVRTAIKEGDDLLTWAGENSGDNRQKFRTSLRSHGVSAKEALRIQDIMGYDEIQKEIITITTKQMETLLAKLHDMDTVDLSPFSNELSQNFTFKGSYGAMQKRTLMEKILKSIKSADVKTSITDYINNELVQEAQGAVLQKFNKPQLVAMGKIRGKDLSMELSQENLIKELGDQLYTVNNNTGVTDYDQLFGHLSLLVYGYSKTRNELIDSAIRISNANKEQKKVIDKIREVIKKTDFSQYTNQYKNKEMEANFNALFKDIDIASLNDNKLLKRLWSQASRKQLIREKFNEYFELDSQETSWNNIASFWAKGNSIEEADELVKNHLGITEFAAMAKIIPETLKKDTSQIKYNSHAQIGSKVNPYILKVLEGYMNLKTDSDGGFVTNIQKVAALVAELMMPRKADYIIKPKWKQHHNNYVRDVINAGRYYDLQDTMWNALYSQKLKDRAYNDTETGTIDDKNFIRQGQMYVPNDDDITDLGAYAMEHFYGKEKRKLSNWSYDQRRLKMLMPDQKGGFSQRGISEMENILIEAETPEGIKYVPGYQRRMRTHGRDFQNAFNTKDVKTFVTASGQYVNFDEYTKDLDTLRNLYKNLPHDLSKADYSFLTSSGKKLHDLIAQGLEAHAVDYADDIDLLGRDPQTMFMDYDWRDVLKVAFLRYKDPKKVEKLFEKAQKFNDISDTDYAAWKEFIDIISGNNLDEYAITKSIVTSVKANKQGNYNHITSPALMMRRNKRALRAEHDLLLGNLAFDEGLSEDDILGLSLTESQMTRRDKFFEKQKFQTIQQYIEDYGMDAYQQLRDQMFIKFEKEVLENPDENPFFQPFIRKLGKKEAFDPETMEMVGNRRVIDFDNLRYNKIEIGQTLQLEDWIDKIELEKMMKPQIGGNELLSIVKKVQRDNQRTDFKDDKASKKHEKKATQHLQELSKIISIGDTNMMMSALKLYDETIYDQLIEYAKAEKKKVEERQKKIMKSARIKGKDALRMFDVANVKQYVNVEELKAQGFTDEQIRQQEQEAAEWWNNQVTDHFLFGDWYNSGFMGEEGAEEIYREKMEMEDHGVYDTRRKGMHDQGVDKDIEDIRKHKKAQRESVRNNLKMRQAALDQYINQTFTPDIISQGGAYAVNFVNALRTANTMDEDYSQVLHYNIYDEGVQNYDADLKSKVHIPYIYGKPILNTPPNKDKDSWHIPLEFQQPLTREEYIKKILPDVSNLGIISNRGQHMYKAFKEGREMIRKEKPKTSPEQPTRYYPPTTQDPRFNGLTDDEIIDLLVQDEKIRYAKGQITFLDEQYYAKLNPKYVSSRVNKDGTRNVYYDKIMDATFKNAKEKGIGLPKIDKNNSMYNKAMSQEIGEKIQEYANQGLIKDITYTFPAQLRDMVTPVPLDMLQEIDPDLIYYDAGKTQLNGKAFKDKLQNMDKNGQVTIPKRTKYFLHPPHVSANNGVRSEDFNDIDALGEELKDYIKKDYELGKARADKRKDPNLDKELAQYNREQMQKEITGYEYVQKELSDGSKISIWNKDFMEYVNKHYAEHIDPVMKSIRSDQKINAFSDNDHSIIKLNIYRRLAKQYNREVEEYNENAINTAKEMNESMLNPLKYAYDEALDTVEAINILGDMFSFDINFEQFKKDIDIKGLTKKQLNKLAANYNISTKLTKDINEYNEIVRAILEETGQWDKAIQSLYEYEQKHHKQRLKDLANAKPYSPGKDQQTYIDLERKKERLDNIIGADVSKAENVTQLNEKIYNKAVKDSGVQYYLEEGKNREAEMLLGSEMMGRALLPEGQPSTKPKAENVSVSFVEPEDDSMLSAYGDYAKEMISQEDNPFFLQGDQDWYNTHKMEEGYKDWYNAQNREAEQMLNNVEELRKQSEEAEKQAEKQRSWMREMNNSDEEIITLDDIANNMTALSTQYYTAHTHNANKPIETSDVGFDIDMLSKVGDLDTLNGIIAMLGGEQSDDIYEIINNAQKIGLTSDNITEHLSNYNYQQTKKQHRINVKRQLGPEGAATYDRIIGYGTKAQDYYGQAKTSVLNFLTGHTNLNRNNDAQILLDEFSGRLQGTVDTLTIWSEALTTMSEVFPPLKGALLGLQSVISVINQTQKISQGISRFAEMGNLLAAGKEIKFLGSDISAATDLGKIIMAGSGALSTAMTTIVDLLVTFAAPLVAIGAALFVVKQALDWSYQSHQKWLKSLEEEQKEKRSKTHALQATAQDARNRAQHNTAPKQQDALDRNYILAQKRLDNANMSRRKGAMDLTRARNDTLWGDYGVAAGLSKLTGNYESTAEDYDGTTKETRKIKEATLANPFATSAMKRVSAYYDANQLAFGQIDEYKDELGELYDMETNIMKKVGPDVNARETDQFKKAVHEFSHATGISGERALKYLDYMQTEHNVDKATQAMQAQADTIAASTEMKIQAISFGGNPADVLGLNGIESQQSAMIKAQADMIKAELTGQLWWKAVWATITAPVKLIISPIFAIANLLGAIWAFMTGNWSEAWDRAGKATDSFNVFGEAATYWSAWGEAEGTDFTSIGNQAVDERNRRNYGNANVSAATGGVGYVNAPSVAHGKYDSTGQFFVRDKGNQGGSEWGHPPRNQNAGGLVSGILGNIAGMLGTIITILTTGLLLGGIFKGISKLGGGGLKDSAIGSLQRFLFADDKIGMLKSSIPSKDNIMGSLQRFLFADKKEMLKGKIPDKDSAIGSLQRLLFSDSGLTDKYGDNAWVQYGQKKIQSAKQLPGKIREQYVNPWKEYITDKKDNFLEGLVTLGDDREAFGQEKLGHLTEEDQAFLRKKYGIEGKGASIRAQLRKNGQWDEAMDALYRHNKASQDPISLLKGHVNEKYINPWKEHLQQKVETGKTSAKNKMKNWHELQMAQAEIYRNDPTAFGDNVSLSTKAYAKMLDLKDQYIGEGSIKEMLQDPEKMEAWAREKIKNADADSFIGQSRDKLLNAGEMLKDPEATVDFLQNKIGGLRGKIAHTLYGKDATLTNDEIFGGLWQLGQQNAEDERPAHEKLIEQITGKPYAEMRISTPEMEEWEQWKTRNWHSAKDKISDMFPNDEEEGGFNLKDKFKSLKDRISGLFGDDDEEERGFSIKDKFVSLKDKIMNLFGGDDGDENGSGGMLSNAKSFLGGLFKRNKEDVGEDIVDNAADQVSDMSVSDFFKEQSQYEDKLKRPHPLNWFKRIHKEDQDMYDALSDDEDSSISIPDSMDEIPGLTSEWKQALGGDIPLQTFHQKMRSIQNNPNALIDGILGGQLVYGDEATIKQKTGLGSSNDFAAITNSMGKIGVTDNGVHSRQTWFADTMHEMFHNALGHAAEDNVTPYRGDDWYKEPKEGEATLSTALLMQKLGYLDIDKDMKNFARIQTNVSPEQMNLPLIYDTVDAMYERMPELVAYMRKNIDESDFTDEQKKMMHTHLDDVLTRVPTNESKEHVGNNVTSPFIGREQILTTVQNPYDEELKLPGHERAKQAMGRLDNTTDDVLSSTNDMIFGEDGIASKLGGRNGRVGDIVSKFTGEGGIGSKVKGVLGGKGKGIGGALKGIGGKLGKTGIGKLGSKAISKVGSKLASKGIAQIGSKVLGGALMATGIGAPLGLLLESPIGGMLIEGAMNLGGAVLGGVGKAFGGVKKALGFGGYNNTGGSGLLGGMLGLGGLVAGGVGGMLGGMLGMSKGVKGGGMLKNAGMGVFGLMAGALTAINGKHDKNIELNEKQNKAMNRVADKVANNNSNSNASGGNITIQNININTDDDPEAIKAMFLDLIVELQEQVNPRLVSRTTGSSNTSTNDSSDQTSSDQSQQQQSGSGTSNITNPGPGGH